MVNIKLTLSYDGAGLRGWQKTPEGPSVEGHLEKALVRVLSEPIYLQAASRTDAGVHAEAQVVNFKTKKELDPKRLRRSLNCLLPPQILIQSVEIVKDSFHPTVLAKGKEYHYYLCYCDFQMPKFRHTSWHFPYSLDLELMEKAARYFVGTHDFSSFCNSLALSQRDPHCTISEIHIDPIESKRLCIKVKGSRFLFRMVRNIVGTLAYTGSGKIDLSRIPKLLGGSDRRHGGITAPAHGLHLIEVFYPEEISK